MLDRESRTTDSTITKECGFESRLSFFVIMLEIYLEKKLAARARATSLAFFVFKSFKTFGSDVSRARFLFTNPFKTIYII